MSKVQENNNKRIAQQHTYQMATRYPNEIHRCITKTEVWNDGQRDIGDPEWSHTAIIVDAINSVEAIFKYYAYNNIAVLNFASYTNPGGYFINGGYETQEECLCIQSFLYNVLREFKGQKQFYGINNQYKNKNLYLNRALWSPDVIFEYHQQEQNGQDAIYGFPCNVITCAAPNKVAAFKYNHITNDTNYVNLKARIDFVLYVAAAHKVNTLVAGAFGCGALGQDPRDVASIFNKLLVEKYDGYFNQVIFAIPPGDNKNLETFEKIINR